MLDESIISDKVTEKILRTLLVKFKLVGSIKDIGKELKISKPTLLNRIETLVEHNLIHKERALLFLTLDMELVKELDRLLPVKKSNRPDRLKRKLVQNYIGDLQAKNLENKDDIEYLIEKFTQERPDNNFDLKKVIHPSMSISEELTVTSVSDAFREIFNNGVDHKKTDFTNLFNSSNVFHYDFKKDEITDENVIEEIFDSLIENGKVKVDICLKDGRKERYFTVYMVVQTNFLGLQSIIPDITDKVEAMRSKSSLLEKFLHYQYTIRNISKDLSKNKFSNDEQNELIKRLSTLTSYDYINSLLYSGDDSYKLLFSQNPSFKLNENILAIIMQLEVIYNLAPNSISFLNSEEYPLSNVYNIYLYEGLFLLFESMLVSNSSDCHCNVTTKKSNNNVRIIFEFMENINTDILKLVESLQDETMKNPSFTEEQLSMQYFIDKINKKLLLEIVIGIYFDRIDIDKNIVVFYLKNKNDIQ